MTSLPKLVAFDLDDTLAPSKSALPDSIRRALLELPGVTQVCVISGGQYWRIRQGALHCVYAEDLTAPEKESAMTAVEQEARKLGFWPSNTWGQVLEDRGSQITFSALG
ncbi:MAG: hypothetical protein CYPHOPRED_004954 [Cyphobasidiales sp. Tagirdzhanova-0007]|nr:MAG: hypothetical protein CYPHOPRED_004954 [Cyphobasidiales sp. Tagirdzhanova-0007]